ncbi:hypothetical protein ASPZODRAFT_131221 [Penicilliopsis zonata CBS 506.65]|uniref:Uncharacterized protein n=1 Tax=Penicilliopsis zonata CBS 506.65 TaxID=1073090 RepID=A0A1L9SKD2_9EURO|nr:hypothetical protein ASPZODRAFT_131221 [Penicilliopsis zonata CBS 506.65]OJJ47670.1 hypothetical protein ASPZODRAFT_131221 [Penicilliopsis zonata CBS 506.65]
MTVLTIKNIQRIPRSAQISAKRTFQWPWKTKHIKAVHNSSRKHPMQRRNTTITNRFIPYNKNNKIILYN